MALDDCTQNSITDLTKYSTITVQLLCCGKTTLNSANVQAIEFPH